MAGATAVAIFLAGLCGWWLHRWWTARALLPDAVQTYKQVPGEALALHVFQPPEDRPSGLRPALLLFHGGGWQHGNASQFHPHCRQLSRHGIVCISAAYRVGSRHGSSPGDALQDARDAMRHLRRHAEAMGIDARRIAAGGGSAGGQLAAALAVEVPWPDPSADPRWPVRPDVLLLFNPMLDLSPGMPDHGLVGTHWLALSPLQHVGPGMPPTLVQVGDADPEVAVATVQRFCAAVRAQGARCDLAVHAGAGHGFFNPGVDGGRHVQPSLQRAEAFLRAVGLLPDQGR